MKKNIGMLSILSLAIERESFMHEERTPNNKILKKYPIKIKKIVPKGLKEFFYGEKVIHALNKKNADRKAKKQGLIT